MSGSSDPRVSEIPLLNERLQAVTTPYVVFKHPFVDRPDRLTRQADVLDHYGVEAFHVIGDVWPNWCQAPYPRWIMYDALKELPSGNKSSIRLWPESVMYKTRLAQQFDVDERVTYRPHMAFWLKLCEEIGKDFVSKCAVATEAYLDVGDRACFPHGFAGVSVELGCADQPLTVLIVAQNNATTLVKSIESLKKQTIGTFEVRVCDCGSTDDTLQLLRRETERDVRFTFVGEHKGTPSAAANKALEHAAGEKIAIWDLSTTSRPWRFSEQLAFDADIVGSEYAELGEREGVTTIQPKPSNTLLHPYTIRSLNAVLPACTLMFDRRLLLDGAFDPVLSTDWGYEFQTRAMADTAVSVAKSHKLLVTRLCPAEELSYGSCYCKMVRRDIIDQLGRGFVHEWPE